MARIPTAHPQPKAMSYLTGFYLPCPLNVIKHRQSLAVPIQKGPKKFYCRCACGAMLFLTPDWRADMGLSEAAAVKMGLLVLTSVIQ